MPLAANTLPVTTFGAGGGSGAGLISLPGVEAALIHVDKGLVTGAEDGTRQNPYHTVAQGLAAAAAVAAVGNPAVCLVYPGEYAEDGLTMATDYVSLVGVGGRDAVRIEGSTQATLTITAELTSVWGVTVAQSLANTSIVTIATATATRCALHECLFESLVQSATAVNVSNGGAYFKDCNFRTPSNWVPVYIQGASSNNDVVLHGCRVYGLMTVGQGLFRLEYSVVHGWWVTATITFTNTGEVYIRHSRIRGEVIDCIRFTSQPNVAVIHDNYLVADSPAYDINATLAVTGFDIAGNLMVRGMHGNISHIDPIKYVAAQGQIRKDYYASLQFAFNACTFDKCVIKLLDNLTLSAEVVPPGLGYTVTLDGNGSHSITFAASSVLQALGQYVRIVDLRIYGFLRINGAGTITFLRSYMEGGVILLAGCTAAAYLRVERSEIIAQGFLPWAIWIADADPFVYVKRSYLKGAANPAIYYSAVNDNLKIEHSTIWHGSGAANLPIGRSAAETPDYCSHHDSYNTDPLAGGWLTNLIAAAQRFNTYDVNSDY